MDFHTASAGASTAKVSRVSKLVVGGRRFRSRRRAAGGRGPPSVLAGRARRHGDGAAEQRRRPAQRRTREETPGRGRRCLRARPPEGDAAEHGGQHEDQAVAPRRFAAAIGEIGRDRSDDERRRPRTCRNRSCRKRACRRRRRQRQSDAERSLPARAATQPCAARRRPAPARSAAAAGDAENRITGIWTTGAIAAAAIHSLTSAFDRPAERECRERPATISEYARARTIEVLTRLRRGAHRSAAAQHRTPVGDRAAVR